MYERLSGRRHWTEVLRLRELQWRPAAELEGRALARLRPLLEHAATHVPHYRGLFGSTGLAPKDVRSLADLAAVPITTKAALRAGFPTRTTADNLPSTRRWRSRTSGSTGFPFEFYTDRAAADNWHASYLFFLEWAGVALRDTRFVIAAPSYGMYRGNTPGPPALVPAARRLIFGEQTFYLAGVDLTASALKARIERLPDGRQYFIQIYPSYAARLARGLLTEGLELPVYPKAVIGVTETMTAANAAAIASAFRCRIVNHYSTWEVLHLAQSCPDNPEVLHVNSERAIVRIVRDDGSSAPPGERGRVLLTDLSNFVMPFINYDIGDLAVMGPPCPCGRGFPTLRSLEGRVGETISTPAGKVVAPGALERLLTFVCQIVPYIWEYQAVQVAADAVVLRVVPTPKFSEEFARKLRRDLEEFMGPGVTVVIEPVDHILLEPSGKRLIIKPLGSADGPGSSDQSPR